MPKLKLWMATQEDGSYSNLVSKTKKGLMELMKDSPRRYDYIKHIQITYTNTLDLFEQAYREGAGGGYLTVLKEWEVEI